MDGSVKTGPLVFRLRDAIAAADRGTAERIRLSRKAVVLTLLPDPRVQECFVNMRRDLTWRRRVARFRRKLRAKVPPNAAVAYSGILKPNPLLGNATSMLVRDLFNCDVPWLSIYLLVYGFITQEIVRVTGLHPQLQLLVDPINASPITINLPPTNTIAEDQRLLREARRTTIFHKRGRVPGKESSVARNASWYVNHVVQGISIRQLARKYHAAEHPGQDRQDFDHDCQLVSRGITKASRLLGLPRYIHK